MSHFDLLVRRVHGPQARDVRPHDQCREGLAPHVNVTSRSAHRGDDDDHLACSPPCPCARWLPRRTSRRWSSS